MNIRKSLLIATAGVALTLCGAASASAGPWQWHHPRRVEVNHRLANQDYRIHRDVRDGDLSHRQAMNLHREDRFVRHEERFDARQDGGHITRADQRSINQQENGVSRQIYNEAH